jgi:subtilisin-like proprotein convertase family protein
MFVPASGSSGPATRYPATINVFGQPTNIANVIVTLAGLSHTRSADLNILLVSPSDKRIMLMSNVGGTNGTSGATLIFQQFKPLPPFSSAIPSWQTSYYSPYNYGQKTQLPGAPVGPYSINLNDLAGDNPNGLWKLYIYDDVQPGGVGQVTGSWSLDFTFQ